MHIINFGIYFNKFKILRDYTDKDNESKSAEAAVETDVDGRVIRHVRQRITYSKLQCHHSKK